jgi:hypothetical protein
LRLAPRSVARAPDVEAGGPGDSLSPDPLRRVAAGSLRRCRPRASAPPTSTARVAPGRRPAIARGAWDRSCAEAGLTGVP